MTTTKWILDGTHSEVQFKVKHLMISTVTGSFKVINATVETSKEDFSNASISFTADTTSVTTGNEQRDGHIKGEDFFNIEKFPSINFTSTAFTKKGDDYTLTGNLTIKDITKPVSLAVEFNGINKDPWGNEKAGFSLSGKINRKDWDLNWNVALETGGLLVSDDVKLLAEVQFVKQ